MTGMRYLVVVSLAFLWMTPDAGAHTRSESYSHWHLSGNAMTGTITVPLREVMLLYQAGGSDLPPGDTMRAELIANTVVSGDAGTCTAGAANVLQAASGFVRIELHFDCGSELPTRIQHRALFDAAPSHVHYAKLHRDGMFLAETLFTDMSDTWNIGNLGDTSTHSFPSFLRIGIEHITGGIDHIAFLIGMLLIAGSVRRSVIAVTGFTLGHSISLAAAVLGYVHAEGVLVEAFIGFTVALVAIEYFVLRRQSAVTMAGVCTVFAWSVGLLAVSLDAVPGRALFAYAGFGVFALCYLLASSNLATRDAPRAGTLLFVATTCFGLVHGFGFAGFLMETGLLGASLFLPLLGFNLGVEVGQLLLVAAALLLAGLLRGRVPHAATPLLAASLCGLGIFWFVGRSLA